MNSLDNQDASPAHTIMKSDQAQYCLLLSMTL